LKISITKRITEIVLNHLDASGMSEREWAEAVNISHPVIGKLRNGNAMTLTTLEKIVNKFPELLPTISAVFIDHPPLKTDESINRKKIARLEAEVAELMQWKKSVEDRLMIVKKEAN
jgi:DNA-binding Xre family transcriptional regulator